MADKKTSFFFDDSPSQELLPEPAVAKEGGFFPSTDPSIAEKEAYYTKELSTEKGVVLEAGMLEIKNRVLELAYGVYQKNYAVHLTPCHPSRNLSTDTKIFNAMNDTMVIMNEYVPQTLTVAICPPRANWKMKVISFVIEGGAKAWNFDIEKFEKEAIPRIFEAVEKVIMVL